MLTRSFSLTAVLLLLAACSTFVVPGNVEIVQYTPTPAPTPIPVLDDLQERLSGLCSLEWQYQYWALSCTDQNGLLIQIPGTIDTQGILTFIKEGESIQVPVENIIAEENGTIILESEDGQRFAYDARVENDFTQLNEIPGQTIPSADNLAANGLSGDGFTLSTVYQEVPVKIIVILAPALQQLMPGQHGLSLNPSLMADWMTPDQRLARLVLLGHYRAYLQDSGSVPETYPFDDYLLDLAHGKEKYYYITGRADQATASSFLKVGPKRTMEIIFTDENPDPNGAAFLFISDQLQVGYSLTEDDHLRLICLLADVASGEIPWQASLQLVNALWTLGWSDDVQNSDGSDHPEIGSETGFESLYQEMVDLACISEPLSGTCSEDEPHLLETRYFP